MATEVMVTVDDQGRASGATAGDAETMASLAGATYRAVLTQPKGRSASQLNLWWGMCQMIADNFDDETLDKDAVSDVLKVECGHATIWQDATGLYRRSPKSIAFNKLDAPTFSALLDRALAQAAVLFGPGLTDAVAAELATMAAPDMKRAA